ncbi:MAG: YgfZ/GcvT domain-containing protein [Aridibacter sp.]
MNIENYNKIRNDSSIGFYKQKRGLIEVSGGEAVQFLDGLITNDMKTLEDGKEMLAAFPNPKGRMLAVVGVLRNGDKYLFETEEETYQKIHDNLFRFTYAGDFHVKDLTEDYVCYKFYGDSQSLYLKTKEAILIMGNYFIPKDEADKFEENLTNENFIEISDNLYETLRIENGIPKYNVDMNEETVVPEVGLANAISYNKGCYIGQEVIARIHFRGKVAKELKGLVIEELFEPQAVEIGLIGEEIKSLDNKNAGTITSITYSPKLKKTIALGYVRNAFLEEGTELKINEYTAKVKDLPFIE